MIKVAIIEDHQAELEGFLHDLHAHDDIDVVATATTAEAARTVIPLSSPDVVLVDLVLPDTTGAALIVELRKSLPSASFLVVSAYEDYDRIYSAILAGAVGYLGKVYLEGGLAKSIREVYAGGSPMSSPIARKLIQAFHLVKVPSMKVGKLTTREQEVLHILATGRSYQEISTALFISVETVRTHIRNIYRKLQVHSWTELSREDLYNDVSPQ